jgi:hypothetical protein
MLNLHISSHIQMFYAKVEFEVTKMWDMFTGEKNE